MFEIYFVQRILLGIFELRTRYLYWAPTFPDVCSNVWIELFVSEKKIKNAAKKSKEKSALCVFAGFWLKTTADGATSGAWFLGRHAYFWDKYF